MEPIPAPPPVLDMARVIAYAAVDTSVRWTGRQTLFVGDKRLGAVPRLALCQNISGPLTDVLLFHCNEQWEVLGVSGGPSVESVKATAERAYEGISSKWVHLDVTPEEAERWVRKHQPDLICGFCGKLPTEIEGFFHGRNAAICFKCVEEMHALVHAERRGQDGV